MSDEKFVPHLSQVKEASKELPDAELWPEETYVAVVKGKTRTYQLTFRRIPYMSREKGKTFRWAYEGLVRVN